MRRIQKTDDSKSIMKTAHKNQKIGRVLSVLIFISVLLTLPLSAFAEMEKYVLDFDDHYFNSQKGEPTTLMLKRMLKQQHPWVNTRDLKLNNVILIAKSKIGRGHAQLRVGRQASRFFRVAGHPKSFKRDHRKSFDRVRLYNPSRTSRGPWQINLRGSFKVRKIVLITEDTHLHRGDYYSWY